MQLQEYGDQETKITAYRPSKGYTLQMHNGALQRELLQFENAPRQRLTQKAAMRRRRARMRQVLKSEVLYRRVRKLRRQMLRGQTEILAKVPPKILEQMQRN